MPTPRPAVLLHTAGPYSIGMSTLRHADIIAQAVADGAPAAALTDRGTLAGAVAFQQAARRAGVQSILGADIAVRGMGRMVLLAESPSTVGPDGGIGGGIGTLYRQFARAESRRLRRAADGDRSAMSGTELEFELTDVLADCEGLYLLPSGPESLVAQAASTGPAAAADLLARLHTAAPGRVGLGLTRRTAAPGTLEPVLVAAARAAQVPLVATAAATHRPDDAMAQRVLHAIHAHIPLAEVPASDALPSGGGLRALFADLPEAVDETHRIATRCQGQIPMTLQLPHAPLPPGVTDADAHLRALTLAGLEARHGSPLPVQYRSALEHELQVFSTLGLSGYMLLMGDIATWASKEKILLGPGRGSAAGSLVSHALGITQPDPIQNTLVFERFLNPDRAAATKDAGAAPPDIDVDWPDDRRNDGMEHVLSGAYGPACRLAVYVTYRAKTTVKLAAAALGLDPAAVASMTASIDAVDGGDKLSLTELMAKSEPLRAAAMHAETAGVLAAAQVIEGLPRQVNLHQSGIAILPGKLSRHVPIRVHGTNAAGQPIFTAQFPYEDTPSAGILKLDFLSSVHLRQLDAVLGAVERRTGVRPDLQQLPSDDPAVFSMLRKGHVQGLTQLTAPVCNRVLRMVQPTNQVELQAVLALGRPATSQLAADYAKRKAGKAPATPPHPKLSEITASTYGLLLYQEQLMQAAQALAGLSVGEADVFRSATSDKDPARMTAAIDAFVARAVARGETPSEMKTLAAQFQGFAGYAFNRAHAVAYTELAYRQAYLKCHHPADFHAELLNAGATDEVSALALRDAQALGVPVLPPSLDRSDATWCVDTAVTANGGAPSPALRTGLASVPNVDATTAGRLVARRCAAGGTLSLDDLTKAVRERQLSVETLRAMANAGMLTDRFLNRPATRAWLEMVAESESTPLRREIAGAGTGQASSAQAPAAPPTGMFARIASRLAAATAQPEAPAARSTDATPVAPTPSAPGKAR
jgi:DNA polymerase-3 subunit alpha